MGRFFRKKNIFFSFLLFCSFLNADSQNRQWTWLPPMGISSHTVRLTDLWDTSAMLLFLPDRVYIGKLGTKVPIFSTVYGTRQTTFEIDLLSLNHINKNADTNRFYLNTSDTKFGFHLDYLISPWTLRFGLKHRSAHLADGLLSENAIANRTHRRKNGFSHEFLETYAVYKTTAAKYYAGLSYIIRQGTPRSIRGHRYLGFSGGVDLSFSKVFGFYPLVCAHLSLAEELDFRLSQSYLAGIKMESKKSPNAFIAGLNYYNGADPRGEFFGDFIHFGE